MRKNKLYLSVDNLSMSYGDRILFNIDSLRIYEGDRIGLVGANGSGKTTLLRIISSEILPDTGIIKRYCEPTYFHQISDSQTDDSQLSPEEISLFGVRDIFGQQSMSGGEETRLRLAAAFSSERPFLMFDEPTCHLDRDGIKHLNNRLDAVPTLMLISHDRALLNRQCTRILELANGTLIEYDGNYDSYLQQKEEARSRAKLEYDIYDSEMKRLTRAVQEKKRKAGKVDKKPRSQSSSDAKAHEFSASHRSPASKAKMLERSAANIEKRMEHMEVKVKPREESHIRPDFRLTDPPHNRFVIQAEHLSFSYENGRKIFDDAQFRIENGRRTALIGPNGSGKTTLINLIRDGHHVSVVPKARIGYFSQTYSDLDINKTVLENAMHDSVQQEKIVRNILARLLFKADDLRKKASVLSGGEKNRLSFAKLFVSDANVLILDEPTNFLDIPSIEAIEAVFSEYEGTLLIASHDETFISAICNEYLIIHDCKLVRK